jgi:hypothetical protein
MTNEERLAAAEARKEQALAQLNSTYDPIINQVDGHFQAQIDASKEWAETQSKNQQEQTDFAIEKIEQQKDQTQKDYTKEQSGAYVDWQKQTGDYGVNAEQMATMGMQNTGYAESSRVSMYNTYQNRVATAREAYTKAVLNYDNAIKDAILQNNAVLAEIAATALEQQISIALEAFQYKNSLIMAKANAVASVNSDYMSVYDQINNDNGGVYDNGGLTTTQVKVLQKEINSHRPATRQIAVNGKWDAQTAEAVGGASAQQYYKAVQPTIHDRNIRNDTSAYWTTR